jgi:OFA family oxalate/formate antiporter-like MFS transporter
MIKSSGYEAAFLWFGLVQGIIVIIVAMLLRAPESGELPAPSISAVLQTRRDYTPAEVLRTAPFWTMYVMFILVAAGGLMAVAQLALIAKDYKVDTIPVTLVGITLPALTFVLSIDRVLNGFCRPFFGWVSDHIGRENTMFIAFLLEGLGIYALLLLAGDPVWFVILSGRGLLRLGRYSRPLPPISTVANLPQRTTGCSTPPRVPRPCWSHWRTY